MSKFIINVLDVPCEETPRIPDEIGRRQVTHAAGERAPGRGPGGRAGGQIKVPHYVAILYGFIVPVLNVLNPTKRPFIGCVNSPP